MSRGRFGFLAGALLVAGGALAQPSGGGEAYLRELHDFTLTPQNVKAATQALEEFNKEVEKNPALAQKLADPSMGADMATVEKRIAGDPTAAKVLRRAGISVHDYMLTVGSMMQAYGFAKMKAQRADFQLPPTINPRHVTFVQQHLELAERLREAMRRRSEAARGR